ncbi:MAG: D-glycero-beta-D-manno-heptose-7-phosphate kinase [Candidatus Schekmanbacteria bacterium]|nr:D-glycero-beta-D-manno-heptose-7-phosphate kinase [Candidatus Schekmanbacteria bacterium]
MDLDRLKNILAGFKDRRLLVMGDLMIDNYIWGEVERISPEAPVQVVDVKKEAYTLGGAGNVVNNLVSLGAKVEVASVIGDDTNGTLLKDEMRQLGVEIPGIISDKQRITSCKTRVIAVNQQVVRLDRETKTAITAHLEEKLIGYVTGRLKDLDALLISDYLKGVLTERLLQGIIPLARKNNIPVIVDPKGQDYGKYYGSSIITPNKKEASLATGLDLGQEDQIICAAQKLLTALNLQAVLITRSKEGMSLLDKGRPILHIPAKAREVYDVSGAGDTVVALLGLGLAQKLSFDEAATLANIAAGIVVSKIGTATVTCDEIFDYVAGEHHYSNNKVKTLKELEHVVNLERLKGKKIVSTFGYFDRLQVNQIKLLQRARRLGDILIVGLWDDETVGKQEDFKPGSLSEEERAHIVSALDCVNYVVIVNQKGQKEMIKALKPQALAQTEDDHLIQPLLEETGLMEIHRLAGT